MNKEDAKLKRACKDFESMMVTQLLGQMRRTIPKSDFFGSSDEEEIFRGMLDQEMATEISKGGAMKLGDLLYAQLTQKR